MSLRDAEIERLYFLTGVHPADFFESCYSQANELVMALGYFSGSAFGVVPSGLLEFIRRDGRMRIVCNDRLYQPDIDAIRSAHTDQNRERITRETFIEFLRNAHPVREFGFKCLSYMIQLGTLELKIARASSLVHYKLGSFSDSDGNKVLFTGSVNYTISGLLFNKEQIQTTLSWSNNADRQFVFDTDAQIRAILNNQVKDFDVIDSSELTDSICEQFPVGDLKELENEYSLLSKEMVKLRSSIGNVCPDGGFFSFPAGIQPRGYQSEAISYWVDQRWKGLLSMATGTGKTLTSLFAVDMISRTLNHVSTVLILVPKNDLVHQWTNEVKEYYDGELIASTEGLERWKRRLSSVALLRYAEERRLVMIFTYDSFVSNTSSILSRIPVNDTVLIADEVHNFGSELRRKQLPLTIPFRIGLSATPTRQFDKEGTEAIYEYFCQNSAPYEISISDAIRLRVLVPYKYFPIKVLLTEEEGETYSSLTNEIVRLSSMTSDTNINSDQSFLSLKLKERHRIIERAENKEVALIEALSIHIKRFGPIVRALFFVPDGSIDGELYSRRYIRLLVERFSLRVAEYVGGSSSTLLTGFAKGDIQALVVKQMLNEGVNIPSVDVAFFISSSTTEREFVQRRGRVLRKAPGKQVAYIYDLVVVPPPGVNSPSFAKSILQGETRRLQLFSDNAQNSAESSRLLSEISLGGTLE